MTPWLGFSFWICTPTNLQHCIHTQSQSHFLQEMHLPTVIYYRNPELPTCPKPIHLMNNGGMSDRPWWVLETCTPVILGNNNVVIKCHVIKSATMSAKLSEVLGQAVQESKTQSCDQQSRHNNLNIQFKGRWTRWGSITQHQLFIYLSFKKVI